MAQKNLSLGTRGYADLTLEDRTLAPLHKCLCTLAQVRREKLLKIAVLCPWQKNSCPCVKLLFENSCFLFMNYLTKFNALCVLFNVIDDAMVCTLIDEYIMYIY